MKKLLSVTIVLCMLISMLCSFPVSADNKLDSLNDYAMDFENGASLTQYVSATGWTPADEAGVTIGQSSMQLVSDPDDASNKVMKVSLGTTEKEFGLTLRSITGSGNGASYVTGTIPVGSRIVYTFRYRFGQKMNATNGVYNGVTYYPEFCINNTGAGFAKSTTLLATAEDQWHTAVLTYTNTTENAQSITQAQLRFCGANDGNGKYQYKMWVADGHTGYDDATGAIDLGERVVYIDDFTAVVETAPVDKIESLNDYSMGFENGKSSILTYASYPANGWATADATVRSSNNFAMQIVKDPANNKNNVLKLTLPATGHSGPIFAATTAQGSSTYATGTIPAGSRIVYTFRYYLGTEMDASAKPQFSIDNQSARFAMASAFETTANQWHEAKLIYVNDTGADASVSQAALVFRGAYDNNTLWKAADGGERVIYFDDFKAIVEKTPEADKIASLNDYSMSFEHGNSSILTYASYPANGWATADATVRSNNNFAMQLVSDPANSKNTVLKLTLPATGHSGPILAATTAQGNGTYATGTIPAGSRIVYTFRYYLGTEMDASGKPQFSIDNQSARFAMASAFETTAGKWHEAKLIYVNDTGADASVSQAALVFRGAYDNNTLWKAADGGERVIYFDDFKAIVEKTPEADKIASLNDYSMGFEHGNSSMMIYATSPARGWATADAVERADSNVAMQLAADPENSKNTVLKLTFADAGKYNGPVFANSTVAGANALATATIPAGSRIVYTFRYYLATEMDSSNNPQFSIGNGYKDAESADRTAFAVSDTAFDTSAGEWHEATLVYTNDTGADLAILDANIITRGGYESATNWKATDGGERVIYFDDFTAVIEEAPAPAITETKIEKVSGGIKVSALDAINGAKLIFVTYDGNGRMLAANLDTEVTLAAKGTQIFPIPEGYENAKVMLWNNLSAFIPLADAIN